MTDDEHLRILKQGVAAWNKWRASNPKIRPDLEVANLTGTDLRGADLTRANLGAADLRGADLGFANLTDADLGFANLTGSDHGVTIVTQEQLDSACLRKGGDPPALREGLKPPQKVCGPQTR